ncbi:MAG: hypothetical protein NVSMB6_26680 [Burkholderiaceae bacterium]
MLSTVTVDPAGTATPSPVAIPAPFNAHHDSAAEERVSAGGTQGRSREMVTHDLTNISLQGLHGTVGTAPANRQCTTS